MCKIQCFGTSAKLLTANGTDATLIFVDGL